MNSDYIFKGVDFNSRYSQFVQNLFKHMGTETLDVLHATVGISGEAGELLDAIKKVWVYNKPVDRNNIVEELGDLNFYMTALQSFYSISDSEIIEHNIAKLQARYKNGYTDQAAQERADKVIPDPAVTLGETIGAAMLRVTDSLVRTEGINTNHAAEYAGAINNSPTPTVKEVEQKHINYRLQSQMNRCQDVCVFFSPNYIDANNFKYYSCSAEPESRFVEHINPNEYQTVVYRGTPAWMEWYNKASKVPA